MVKSVANLNGFTLLEVLVSVFILILVFLGLEAMELIALHQSQMAYHLSIATCQLNNMTERLRAFQGREGVEQEIEKWNKENKTVLPQGEGRVSGKYILIKWGKARFPCHPYQLGGSGCLVEKIS